MPVDFPIIIVERPESVEQLCADLRRKHLVAVDVETEETIDDYHPKGRTKLFSVQYGLDDEKGTTYFVPTYGEHKANVEAQRSFIEDPNQNKVLHNGKFDAIVCMTEGLKFRGLHCDTFVAEYTAYTDNVHPDGSIVYRGLKYLGAKYFGYTDLKTYKEEFSAPTAKRKGRRTTRNGETSTTGFQIQHLIDVNREIGCERMGSTNRRIVEYACKDPYLTIKLYHHVKKRLNDQAWLSRTMRGKSMWDYYQSIERRFTEVLIKMEWNGAHLDTTLLPSLDKAYEEEQRRLRGVWNELLAKYGAPAGLSHTKNDDVALLLEKYCGLRLWKQTDSGKYSVDKKVLQDLLPHDVPKLVLQMRSVDKGRSTYIKELLECSRLFNGYVHSNYNQCGGDDGSGGTRTGRLSSDHPNCFSPDTEILTKGGWVRIDKLPEGEPVAAWSTSGDVLWQTPIAYYKRDYIGEMVHIGGRVDVLVTPEHRMVCFGAGRFFDVVAKDVRKQTLPTAGVLGEGVDEEDHILRFICASQADGSLRPKNAGELELRFGFRKHRKITRLKELLALNGITYSCWLERNGTTSFSMTCPSFVLKYLDSKHVFKEKNMLGLSLRSRRIILDELKHWDGNVHSKGTLDQYWTYVISNAHTIMTLAAVSGVKASLGVYKNAVGGDRYAVSLMRGRALYNQRPANISRETYAGPVYCLSVPSTYVLTRRNGRVCVTGQCQNVPATEKGDKDTEAGQLGRKVRQVYNAPPGKKIGCIDGSQIEVRMAALFSKDKMLTSMLRSGLDMHSITTIEVFPEVKSWVGSQAHSKKLLEEIATKFKDQRAYAKNVRFASQYKAGGKKVAQMCKVPDDKGYEMVKAFWEMHSGLRDYGYKVTEQVLEKGYVVTLLGRRGWIGGALNPDPKKASTAAYMQGTSTQFQGSVADLTKLWMILIDDNCPEVEQQGQIHDELVMRATLEEFARYGRSIESYVSEPLKHYAGVDLWLETPADLGVADDWAGAKAKSADGWRRLDGGLFVAN